MTAEDRQWRLPEAPYTPLEPLISELRYYDGVERPYEPVFPLVDAEGAPTSRFAPLFVLPDGVPATADCLQLLFLPDSLIQSIVKSTNAYAKRNEVPSKLLDIDEADILRFLAIYYYMGIVKLPYRRDYWKQADDFWPMHQPCLCLARNRFDYIWRYLHMTEVEGRDVEVVDIEGDDDDEPVALEQDDDRSALQADDVEREADTRWYKKAAPLIDHVNKISRTLCKHPGFALSIDEMMTKFKGRSGQTSRMKNKPIKEGFKFFSLCDSSTGYVWNFIPDGRLVKWTIADIVLTLTKSIPRRQELRYVVAMDNYFTYAKILAGMRDLGVGCIGTARFKSGWPPEEYKAVNDTRFNTLYLLNDKDRFRIGRWVDNNVVTMVSTVHTGHEKIRRSRKKPRTTNTNRANLVTVWGTEFVRSIEIPGMIDDYNHWMLGVDKADQLVAYYRPRLRCRRVWMPLMFHAFDILRVNAYIISQAFKEQKTNDDHKEFVVDFVRSLLQRAASYRTQATRRRVATLNPSPPKRRRTSLKNPSLPSHRFRGNPEDHVVAIRKGQKNCIYCSYLRQLASSAGQEELPTIRRVSRYCTACNDSLCNLHFVLYHTKDDEGVAI
jgi:hypothetical protein